MVFCTMAGILILVWELSFVMLQLGVCIIDHTGYCSCKQCIVKGSWEGRVVLNEKEDYPSRTVTDFNNTVYENHQVEPIPLLQISNLDFITQFALDYIHLVCLGVVKCMLTFLKQELRICKLSNAMVQDISNILLSLSGKMPSEFSRQPRSLTEIERWKATEFRQYVLYTDPLALKSVIDKDLYQHFLTLHISMSILLSSCNESRAFYLDFAEQLLKYFLKNASNFYGPSFTVYNVHALLHIHDDVRNFSCSLNDISAFEFENFKENGEKR